MQNSWLRSRTVPDLPVNTNTLNFAFRVSKESPVASELQFENIELVLFVLKQHKHFVLYFIL